MKRLILCIVILTAAIGVSAQRDTLLLWDFNDSQMAVDTIGTHTSTGAYLTVPHGVVSSNDYTSAAVLYKPYIQKDATGNNTYGYFGPSAMMVYGTSMYNKPYFILPSLGDLSQYENLELVFWARAGYRNISNKIAWGNDTYQRELCVGYVDAIPERGSFLSSVTQLLDTVLPNTGSALADPASDTEGTAFFRKISINIDQCADKHLAFYANCTKKNYIYIDHIAIVGTPRTVEPFTCTLSEAVWNFDNYENTKPSVSSDLYLVPENWIVGNGGSRANAAAYCPFIYPYTGDASSSYGYDGRLCMRIYHNAAANRVAPFAVLPLITDASYDNLQLCFMGKGETSSTSAVYHNRLRIGYITDINDTLKANFNAAVVHFHDETLPTAAYQAFTISLAGIPAGARVVFYDDDADYNNSVLLDNIRIERVSAEDPEPPTPCEPVSVELTETADGFYTWNGQTYTESGDYTYVGQTVDGCDSTVVLHLTIIPIQYTEARAQVYAYYPHLTACFKWDVLFKTSELDPTYAAAILDTIAIYDPNTTIDGITSGFVNEISVAAPDGVTYTGALDAEASDEGYGYWMYDLNDELANLGIKSQPIVDGDVIFWEFKTDWTDINLTNVADLPANTYLVDFGFVNIAPVITDTTATACDAFSWKGEDYTASGDYTANELVDGIRHQTTLHLTVNKSVMEEITETHQDSLLWNGQLLTESGDYTYVGQTEQGCDSTVVLHLTIEKTSALADNALQAMVWPNPAVDVLHISAADAARIYIYDATGRLIVDREYEEQIGVSQLAEGMYIIRITSADGRQSQVPFFIR